MIELTSVRFLPAFNTFSYEPIILIRVAKLNGYERIEH